MADLQEEELLALASALVAAATAIKLQSEQRADYPLDDDYTSPMKLMADAYMQRYGVNKDELHASLEALRNGEYYVKPRSLVWFDDFLMESEYDEARWKKNFWMSKETFDELVEVMRPHLEKKSTKWKPIEMIEVERRVAVFLYRVSHNTDYFTLSEKFAVGCSSITYII
jgi:hypothetical protein